MKYIKFTLTRPVPDNTCDECPYYIHDEVHSAFGPVYKRDMCILFDTMLDGNKRDWACKNSEITEEK